MAKRKARISKNGKGPKSAETIRDYIQLMNGSKLYLLPITEERISLINHQVEKNFEDSDDFKQQPFYFPNNDPEAQPILWEVESMEKDGTPEEKQQWAEYEKSQSLLSQKQWEVLLKTCIIDGTSKLVSRKGSEFDLEIDDVTGEFSVPEHWRKRQKSLGVELPQDPYELKYLFVSPLISDIQSQQELFLRCSSLAMRGVATEEDVIAYIDAVFQVAVGSQQERLRGIIDNQIGAIAEVSDVESQQ